MGIWELNDELLGQESALFLFYKVQSIFIHLQTFLLTMTINPSESAVKYSVIFTEDG